MRSQVSPAAVAVLALVWLAAASVSAQVDWSDVFPEEPAAAAKPAPAPAVKPPPAPVPVQAAKPAPPPPVQAVKPAAPPPVQAAKPVGPPPAAAPPVEAAKPAAPPPVAAPVAVAAPPRDGQLPALAEFGLKEGDVVSKDNVDQFTEILSPGLEWGVRYAFRMNVVEPKHIEMPRRYREATEKYSGQVQLGPGGTTLRNYVAGMPFPQIDPNDPDVAMKIMWNFYYSFRITDDFSEYLFEADTGPVGPGQPIRVERHYIIDSLRRLNYNGRLFVPPHPELPNPDGLRYKQSLHPMLEPFDLKGVGLTEYRYLDPSRQDDTWLYLPQLRRVRRMSSAQRSDALFGQDVDADSFYGYNGHIAWMSYSFLGERTILQTMHARNIPVKWQEPEDWVYDDVWEPRRVYVIEAKSKFPQYAYGKRIIFIDKQAWVVGNSDIYDRAGQLWKIWLNMFSFKKTEAPGATAYEDEMPFHHAIVAYDMQLAHATKVALPSTKATNLECHFFNQGEKAGINESFFTVAHLIEVGH
jgi:hypothetical protein